MQPHSAYLVCATPRSGSTLLCEALTNTGIAGHPKEYFEALKTTGLPRRPREYFEDAENADIRKFLGSYSRIDDEPTPLHSGEAYLDYLARVFEEGTTPNGIFGAKVMWGYLDDFVSNLRTIPEYTNMAVPQLLATIFPNLRYLRVTRRDKVRQAVSLWKAIQTQAWQQDEVSGTTHIRYTHTHEELVFHFDAIDHLVAQMIAHEAAWQHYFDTIGIQPMMIVYEELAAAYEETALKMLHYLDIPISDDRVFAPRKMKQQADALSEAWVKQYYQNKK